MVKLRILFVITVAIMHFDQIVAPPPPDKTSSAPSVPDGLPPSYEDAQAIAAINAEMEKKCAGPKTKLNFAACWKKLSGKTKSAMIAIGKGLESTGKSVKKGFKTYVKWADENPWLNLMAIIGLANLLSGGPSV